jgi:Zn-finger nucleic acid-binding protein
MKMKCPVCSGTDLSTTERQGVEIDYCPSCRGVWLDRGELDKIVERSNEMSGAPAGARDSYDDNGRDDHHDSRHDHDEYGGHAQGSKKKKGGFLGDILGGLGG